MESPKNRGHPRGQIVGHSGSICAATINLLQVQERAAVH